MPSGGAGGLGCDLLIAGAEFGSIARISVTDIRDQTVRAVSYSARRGRLASSANVVLTWSQAPEFLGTVAVDDLAVTPLVIPLHEWLGVWVGPVVPIGRGKYAMAAAGDGTARRAPLTAKAAPLVHVIDEHGRVHKTVGQMAWGPGHYVPWLVSRVALGVARDSIFLVGRSDAVLSVYPLSRDSSTIIAARRRQLPTYFIPPVPREEIWFAPWIQIGGEMQHLIEVPHLGAAAFGHDGKLYAVRNYSATWTRGPNRFFKSQGAWEVTDSGLEVYNASGDLIGAYSLPDGNVSWLQVVSHNRLLIKGESKSIIVAQDPTAASSSCTTALTSIPVSVADKPLVQHLGSM